MYLDLLIPLFLKLRFSAEAFFLSLYIMLFCPAGYRSRILSFRSPIFIDRNGIPIF